MNTLIIISLIFVLITIYLNDKYIACLKDIELRKDKEIDTLRRILLTKVDEPSERSSNQKFSDLEIDLFRKLSKDRLNDQMKDTYK